MDSSGDAVTPPLRMEKEAPRGARRKGREQGTVGGSLRVGCASKISGAGKSSLLLAQFAGSRLI